jgi:hypothetical protein
MAYERCVRKKLRSLFEYLDHDKDGRITPSCLQSGLIRLQNYSMESSTKNGTGTCSSEYPQICEYEVEELLRAVPRCDNPPLLLSWPFFSFASLTHTYTYTHAHCVPSVFMYHVFIRSTSEFAWKTAIMSCTMLCYTIPSHPIPSHPV